MHKAAAHAENGADAGEGGVAVQKIVNQRAQSCRKGGLDVAHTDFRKQASCFFMVFHGIFSVQDRSAADKGSGNIVKNVSNYTMEPVSCEPLAGIFMQFTGENVCENR